MNNENVLISIRAQKWQIWPPKCPFAEFCWLNVLLAVCRTIPDLVDILCDFSKKTCAIPDLVDILCDFYKQKRVQSQISLTFVCDFSSKIIMWDIIDILCDFSQQRVIICNLVDILCDFFQQRIMCTLMQSHWRYLRLSQQWIMCTCLQANKEWYDPDHGTLRHFLNSSHSCTCGVRPMRSFHVSSHLISEFQTCPFRSFSSSCANFQRLRSWWHRGESCWEHENWNSIRWIEIRFAELKFQFAELKFQFAELVFQFIGSIQILSIRAIQFEFSINSHRFNSVNWNPNSIQWIELLELSFDSSNSRSESIHLFVFDSIRAVSCRVFRSGRAVRPLSLDSRSSVSLS